MICLVIFVGPFSFYYLEAVRRSIERSLSLDLGIVTVSAVLGGLILNAGLNLKGHRRKESTQVAQKFILVVVLMTVFLPSIHAVELMRGIDLGPPDFSSSDNFWRGIMFFIASSSFFSGIIVFIIALVDLIYTTFGVSYSETADETIVSPHA